LNQKDSQEFPLGLKVYYPSTKEQITGPV